MFHFVFFMFCFTMLTVLRSMSERARLSRAVGGDVFGLSEHIRNKTSGTHERLV